MFSLSDSTTKRAAMIAAAPTGSARPDDFTMTASANLCMLKPLGD